jgi:hypothetical protein
LSLVAGRLEDRGGGCKKSTNPKKRKKKKEKPLPNGVELGRLRIAGTLVRLAL